MCGDCREKKAVSELMNGRLADLCVTDPPYNVSYQGDTAEQLTIDNDSMENDTFLVFLRQVFSYMFQVMKPGAGIYVFHADSEGGILELHLNKQVLSLLNVAFGQKLNLPGSPGLSMAT